MKWHELVFSRKPNIRILRHLLFWGVWWLYFSFCQYLYLQPAPGKQQPYFVMVGSLILLKTFLLIAVDALACYAFLYIGLPLLMHSKWLKVLVNTLFLSTVLLVIAYVVYWNVFPFIDSVFGTPAIGKIPTRFWPAISLGLLDPLKVVTAAGIIKYAKYWMLNKEENEKLEREKINAELELLKAQVHPSFLFNALNNIYIYSLSASPLAPELLLKLSDLLSYMLYECDQPTVPLEKEMEMIKDYITLENTRLNNAVEMEVTIHGVTNDKWIAPFLLLPFIENSFRYCSNTTEHSWINLDIQVEEKTFCMKLANGIEEDMDNEKMHAESDLVTVQKRLSLIYPGEHQLKISREAEMLLIVLKIELFQNLITATEAGQTVLLAQPALT
jgi:hypothetical protein